MKSVIVLGNARSGTSMTAGLLSILGVNLNHRDNPCWQNPKGAFENIAWNELTMDLHKAEDVELLYPRLQKLVSENQSDLWGFKSAMTHYTLGFILSEIENPHLVIVFRNLLENAKSFILHQKDIYHREITLDVSLEKMMESTQELVLNSNASNAPKVHTTYEDIKADSEKEIRRIGDFLGIEVTEEHVQQASEFIMPNYSTLKTAFLVR